MKLLLITICGVALSTVLASAQTSSTTTTTAAASSPASATTTTTSTTESTGTVTEFTPGQTLILKTEAEQPLRYKFSKSVTYVTADGKVIEASKIRKDSKVRVHYVKDGDDMMVDKVIVTQD